MYALLNAGLFVFRPLGPSALLAVLGTGGLGTAPNHLRMD